MKSSYLKINVWMLGWLFSMNASLNFWYFFIITCSSIPVILQFCFYTRSKIYLFWCSFHSTEDLQANQRREKWMIFFRESTLWGDISRQGRVGMSGAYPISYFPHLIGFYFGFRFSYLHFDRKNFSSSSWFWLLRLALQAEEWLAL